jgi:hypothetical protein
LGLPATRVLGDRRRVDLEVAESLVQAPSEDLAALDESLIRLAAHDPVKAEVVKLRFFAGRSMSLGPSPATAERDWAHARLWPHAELTEAGLPHES